jgi:hypothetical protein
MLKMVHDYVLQICNSLGYDFNTVEMAVRNGVPYAIDFCNPAPDAEVTSVGQENFDWVVEHAAKMAVERAQNIKPGGDNLTWGTFVTNSVSNFAGQVSKAKPAAKTETKKTVKPKSAKK